MDCSVRNKAGENKDPKKALRCRDTASVSALDGGSEGGGKNIRGKMPYFFALSGRLPRALRSVSKNPPPHHAHPAGSYPDLGTRDILVARAPVPQPQPNILLTRQRTGTFLVAHTLAYSACIKTQSEQKMTTTTTRRRRWRRNVPPPVIPGYY